MVENDTSRPTSTVTDDQRLTAIAALLVVCAGLAGCTGSEEPGEQAANQATVTVDFDGAREEGPQQVERSVAYDPDKRPTMQLYEGSEVARPDAYNVHDLLSTFAADTGMSIELEETPDHGFQVVAIDGVPGEDEDLRWRLYANEEPRTASLSTLVVEEGVEYTWRLEATDGDGSVLEMAEVIVDYNGFRGESPQRTADAISYDPTARPAVDQYEDAGTDRPEAYNLHDLMVRWSQQTGTELAVEETGSTAYRLVEIDNVTAHSTEQGSWRWQLSVDGEERTASLSAIEVAPGATYAWSFVHSAEGS